MLSGSAGHFLPQLSVLTKVFLALSAIGSTAAMIIRRRNGRSTPIGGWCSDGLNIFTVLIISAVIYLAFTGDQSSLDDILTQNIGLMFWSLVYCAVMLVGSLYQSVVPKSADPERDRLTSEKGSPWTKNKT
jgi:hypothetical protein